MEYYQERPVNVEREVLVYSIFWRNAAVQTKPRIFAIFFLRFRACILYGALLPDVPNTNVT